jgi:hypothetical protein
MGRRCGHEPGGQAGAHPPLEHGGRSIFLCRLSDNSNARTPMPRPPGPLRKTA